MSDTQTSATTSSAHPEEVFAIQYQGELELLELLADLLAGEGLTPSIWHRREEVSAILSLYYDSLVEAEHHQQLIGDKLAQWQGFLPGQVETLPLIRLPRENWAESWKQYFHVDQVSSRIVIKPSWEPFTPTADQVVVEIDPGMSFGTGQHGTTVACLQFLDHLSANGLSGSLADAGCGSGILSIAAAKLGFTPIDAFDYDPIAVDIARENCRLNGIGDTVRLRCLDLGDWQPVTPYPLVVANILAPVLIEHAGMLGQQVAANGQLILSGILSEQFAEVDAAFRPHGFHCQTTITLAEWTSGRFTRDA